MPNLPLPPPFVVGLALDAHGMMQLAVNGPPDVALRLLAGAMEDLRTQVLLLKVQAAAGDRIVAPSETERHAFGSHS